MLKYRHIILTLAACMILSLTGCDEKKELHVVGNDRPFKVKTCFLIGNVTPKNKDYDIDRPDLLEQDEKDPYIWRYHGVLNEGTFKLCFKSGTWAQAFIHPITEEGERYDYIDKQPITAKKMGMPRQGGNDELWWVKAPGTYLLEFNLRDWTFSSTFEKEFVYDADELFILGSVTPDNPNWDVNKATPLVRSEDDPNVWVYDGELNPGTFKISIMKGTWDQPYIHPMTDGEEIGREEITDRPMQSLRKGEPDELWKVVESGLYTLTFNIAKNTYSSRYNGPVPTVPTEYNEFYVLGDCTAANPTMDPAFAEPLTRSASDPDIWTFASRLTKGQFKIMTKRDTWSCPQIHPVTGWERYMQIGAEPASGTMTSPDMPDPEDKLWQVMVEGDYTLTFNMREHTWSSEFGGSSEVTVTPIETENVYLLGPGSPTGDWDLDNSEAMQRSASDKYIFTWSGELSPGVLRFAVARDWTWMIRPVRDNEPIGTADITAQRFEYLAGGIDYNWLVTAPGKYTITLDLRKWTITTKYDGPSEAKPVEADMVYMFGEALGDGWDMAKAFAMTPSSSDKYVFTWQGQMSKGQFLFTLGTTDWTKMIRPINAYVTIETGGENSFDFWYPNSNNYCWIIPQAGEYSFEVDLRSYKINAKFIK